MSHSGAVISTYYYLRDAQGNEMCRYVKYTNTTSQLMYVAQEHSIYGSSRVGVDNRKDTLYKAGSYSPAWGGANTSRRALGLKSFELANHLGNVLVTVSDKPVYKVSSGSVYFNPEVSSISDYYPFGAPIAGRSAAFGGEYRFGFNTQEKTDEISGPGNHNTATFWEYDTRLGRRWNTDPVTKPWESLYAINGDNPIFYTDPKGDFKTWLGAQLYKYSHGGRGHVSKANSGIHKGEWSVSNRVDTKGGEPANEISVGEVRIKQQVRWEWGQSNTTEKAQSEKDITGSRLPDFYSFNVTLAIPNPYTTSIIGWSGSISIDRHGQIFASPLGFAIGKSAFWGSASLTANYLIQSNKPTASETYNFLSGHGISIGAGYIGGANWAISPTNSGTNNALGVGFYTPQIGASYNYTPENFIFFKK